MKQHESFDLAIDGKPYIIKATENHFNGQPQYQVSVNDGDEVVFAFDPQLGRYAPVGDDATDITDGLEIEIGQQAEQPQYEECISI